MSTNKQTSKRVERAELAKVRAEIAANATLYREARAALVARTRSTNAERRTRAKQTAEELRAIRRRLRATPRAMVERVRAARDSYRFWWTDVLAERQRRRDEIADLRDHLTELRRAAPQLVMDAVRRHQSGIETESPSPHAASRGAASEPPASDLLPRPKVLENLVELGYL